MTSSYFLRSPAFVTAFGGGIGCFAPTGAACDERNASAAIKPAPSIKRGFMEYLKEGGAVRKTGFILPSGQERGVSAVEKSLGPYRYNRNCVRAGVWSAAPLRSSLRLKLTRETNNKRAPPRSGGLLSEFPA